MLQVKKAVLILIIFIVVGCARRGNPTGGPKDEKAPIMVTAKPAYKTTNFNKKSIRIYFNEFIVLKDLQKQLIISPPMKYNPIITPQGTPSKYINIKIIDTLKKNTTYTFNFGNAVQDNNENNKLESFKYVFSTGNTVDSLKLKGKVAAAFEENINSNTNVLLYEITEKLNDSVIYKQRPDYVAQTLDSINFEFTNIKQGKYLLFAVNEKNSNYIFNPASEKVGFHNNIIELPKDTVVKEPIKIFKEKLPYKLLRSSEVSKGYIQFRFKGEAKNIKARTISKVPPNFSSISMREKGKDTLNYWFTPIKRDSLVFAVSNKNSTDTVTIFLRKKKIDSLKVNPYVSPDLNFRDTVFVKTNNPITKIDDSKILFTKDSLKTPFTIKKQSPLALRLDFKRTQKSKYELLLLPKAVTDIFGMSNKDTIKANFATRTYEDYSTLALKVETTKPTIIELLDASKKVYDRKFINNTKTVKFTMLNPGEYTLRAIIDENKNKTWDTGNVLKKQQPETVIYYQKKMNLRANWLVNETFKIK